MRTLYLISVWLHVIAACVWVGGMLFLTVVMLPSLRRFTPDERRPLILPVVRRFHRVASIALLTLAVTGTFNLYRRGIRLGDFFTASWWGSTFGLVVTAKIALFVLSAAFVMLHTHVKNPGAGRYFARATLLAGLVMVALAVFIVRPF